MSKKLSDMNLSELWRLFPITLVPHNPDWKMWYKHEARRIIDFLPRGSVFRISHIGSTAIESICAKPIVDILLEVNNEVDTSAIGDILCKNGYQLMSAGKMTFNKGYTPQGYAQEVFHVHVRSKEDNDELYFRDYLNTHPQFAKQYESLKLSLSKKYKHNRDAYTDQKTHFVKAVTNTARNHATIPHGMKQKLIDLLSGGDLRSIASSNKVVERIRSQTDFDELFSLLYCPDRLLVMRAADVIEKITQRRPVFLQSHIDELLDLYKTAKDKELKWHLALIAPRMHTGQKDQKGVEQTLLSWLQNPDESVIVRVNSLQSLHDMGYNQDILFAYDNATPPALRARIQKLARKQPAT